MGDDKKFFESALSSAGYDLEQVKGCVRDVSLIEEEKVASYVMAVAQNVADLKMSVDSAHKKEAAKKPVVALENFQCSYFAYLFWQRDDYLIVL